MNERHVDFKKAYELIIGNKVLNNTIVANPNQVNSPLSQSVSLHIESMTMSPNWEAQYLQNPVFNSFSL